MNSLSPTEHRRTKEIFGLNSTHPVYSWEFSGYDQPSKVHTYDVHNVIFGISGSARLRTNEGNFRLREETLLITTPDTPRVFTDRKDYCGGSILYLTEWLMGDDLLREGRTLSHLFLGATLFPGLARPAITVFSISSETRSFLQRCLREIEAEYACPKPSLFEIRLIFLRLLHRLARDYEAENAHVPERNFRDEVWNTIDHIERIVRQHEDLDVGRLSRDVGCSRSHLYHLFHQATGSSPMGYFQRRRMQYASLLLLRSSDTITEIAHCVGCADAAHFSRLFRREMNFTPSAYRKRFAPPAN